MKFNFFSLESTLLKKETIMRTWNRVLLVCLAATASALAIAAAVPGAGLNATAHDFASASSGVLSTQIPPNTANSVGLCTYCHTPHSALSQALLWNHKLSAATFTWDEAKTAGGTPYASMAPGYKGPTVKCLSCHDGTVAIGDINLYQEQSPVIRNTMQITGMHQIASGGKLNGSHPVGMPYPFGGVASTYNTVTTGLDVVLTEFQAEPRTVGGANAKVKLYQTNTSGTPVGGATNGLTGIECSSCHDPHNKQTTDELFLRGKVAGSTKEDGYICLQCHIK